MQFQVPQFIETEDKIVGPLSLRQFIYVGIGAGLSALLYFVLQLWVWVIIAAILTGGAIAISFVKVEGRPLIKVIASAFNFYWSPQTYIWQPEHRELTKTREAEADKGPTQKPARAAIIQKVAQGMALHQSWETVQTGEKISDKQFAEEKMSARYQIFQKPAGDRGAARRVDYR